MDDNMIIGDAVNTVTRIIKIYRLAMEMESLIPGVICQDIERDYVLNEAKKVRDSYNLLKKLGCKHEYMPFIGAFNEIMETYRKNSEEIESILNGE